MTKESPWKQMTEMAVKDLCDMQGMKDFRHKMILLGLPKNFEEWTPEQKQKAQIIANKMFTVGGETNENN